MKTTELTQICPYTGLRSFSEEESLYFKGRDLQVDQITALLEKNKFLMVTGASGEGKSSLIYAGIIPNARAGFFKARYANWVVADFRPERSPVANMALSLADKFSSKPATIETELRRGYSSLIDLYTSSEFYADEEDVNWKSLSDADQKGKKRKASNLLILVDQFEEFFTNPENFSREAPSQDSQIVVNLILETARIAIKRNLPVYVVCTMRSDYIGQCSAFRGLPEYIGFSQFFVPRLKRKDLKQVIEEPAILSGNRISQRLIERLVFDIAEGVDQLPILQHALSQIWLSANQGSEEMDLIHYAMVGGMPERELPDEDQQRFKDWGRGLHESQRGYYEDTGLNKVIEIHASVLYDNAWSYYNKKHPENLITQQEAKRIIALAFSCLTKIDNGRAVRNRMSLAEITGIINVPKLSVQTVGEVLDIYREEGNSFIRPFIVEDGKTHPLSAETVLDITHESLIRNWNKLNTWANQEFEFYSTYQDFKKQLDRWKRSGKSSGYLLPIGPLTYFENWYTQCKPNLGWIKRYSEIHEDTEQNSREAVEILSDTKDFLKRSARNVLVTRTFMKYGPTRIGTVLAIVIMLVLSGYYWYDAEQKTNSNVIERVQRESFDLMKSQETEDGSKSSFLLAEERYHPGTLIPYLSKLEFKSRIVLSVEVYKILMFYDKRYKGVLKHELQSLIEQNFMSPPPGADMYFLIPQQNRFVAMLMRDNYYNPAPDKVTAIANLTDNLKGHVLTFYKDKSLFRPFIPGELNLALQYWLTAGNVTPEKIRELLASIAPLEGPEAEASFNVYYAKGSLDPNGRQGTDFNNGFHTLASLYAAIGDLKNIQWCFEKLIVGNQRPYFELGRIFNNHLNILGYLYQYNHRDQVPGFLKWISSNTNDNPEKTVYRNAIIRAGYISPLYVGGNIEPRAFRSYVGHVYPNLFFADRTVFEAMVHDYEEVLARIPDAAESNFELAMSNKRMAMYMHKYWFDRQMPIDESRLDAWLKKAIDHYNRISPAYLAGTYTSTTRYFLDGVRSGEVVRRDLFIYPDYRDGWFSQTYHSDYLFQYLNRNGLLPTIYKSGNDLQAIHYWIAKAFEVWPFPAPLSIDNDYALPDKTLEDVLSFVDQHPEGNEFDKNLVILVLANRAFERGDTIQGKKYYLRFEQKNIPRSSNKYEYLEKTFFLNMMNQLCVNLVKAGFKQEALALTEKFFKDHEKAFTYIFMAESVYEQNANPDAFVYLDSTYSKYKNIDFNVLQDPLDSRYNLGQVLSLIGSDRINNMATEIVKEIPERGKFDAINAQVIGIASEGNFYRALTSIPNTLTESQDLECRVGILLEACKKQERTSGDHQWDTMDRFLSWPWYYVFYNPN